MASGIVPEMSHLYSDTGDTCQTWSGQTLMPLAAGKATVTRAEVEGVRSADRGAG